MKGEISQVSRVEEAKIRENEERLVTRANRKRKIKRYERLGEALKDKEG